MAVQNKFDHWRKCWETYLLGTQENTEGEYERKVIESVDRMASLELDFHGYADDSECTYYTPVYGLRARAMAYRTKGSRYYHDEAFCKQVLTDLETFCTTEYVDSLAPDRIENWWGFEIGIPLRILDILILLYDKIENREAVIRRCTDTILHFKDAYLTSSRGKPETGANLMWKCHIMILTGILRQETEWIDWANEQLPTMLKYSKPINIPGMGTMYDDGFYEDGSFIQHYMFSYTGGYGKNFLYFISGLLYAFHGEECLRLPEENREFLYQRVKDTYLPLLYKGHMMDVCRGREPSRYWCQDWNGGTVILRALLYLRTALPKAEQEELDALLKEQLSLKETRDRLFTDFHPSSEYFASASLAERLRDLDKSEVPASQGLTGHYNFGVMCKPVHRTPRYSLAVSMYSKNIACYEKLMLESNKFWHISDGATYLYTGEGNGYCGDYYAAADMQRLAGTTVERSADRTEDPYYSWYLPEARNVYAFAGGTALDKAGIAGMQYRGQGSRKERTLEVRKSWFMFENEIVCLGSGITSPTSNTVETVISNDRLLDKNLRFRVMTPDGEITLRYGEETVLFTEGLYIDQVTANGDMTKGNCGYVFPEGAEIHILTEHRQGTWNSTELNPAHISENDYLTVWISHGSSPVNDTYAYVILPACSKEEWISEIQNPKIHIEENTGHAHAVRSLREHMLGICFWQETPYICAETESSTQACVLIKKDPASGKRTVSVSDPTKQNRTIRIRILSEPEFCAETDTSGTNGAPVIITK